MKRSIKLEFKPGGKLRLETGQEVQNEQSMVRSAVLNLLSGAGRDPIYVDRGTDIGWSSFGNLILSLTGAGAVTKVAALDTLFFIRTHTIVDTADRPEEIDLLPVDLSANSLKINFACTTVDGRSLSYPIES